MSAIIKPKTDVKYWHAGRIFFALARYFDYLTNHMISQFTIDGGIADLVFISRAGYATEVEIKISMADWNADQQKDKWAAERPHIARFFYAIPETLEDRIPQWLPAHSGILVCRRSGKSGRNFDQVSEIRAATRRPARKLPDRYRAKIHELAYYRFWRQEMQFWQRRLHSGEIR
jgi:hypothetical protein